MLKKCKIIYSCAIVLIFIYSIITCATSILYTNNQNIIGPGIDNQNASSTKNIEKEIISSDSELKLEIDAVYTHDGIDYVKGEYVGNFGLSGYCACKKCGTGTGITASGKPVRENHTIAADWSILPKGTIIVLENAVGKDGTVYDGVYVVEDRGGGIKNNKIDIYRPTHDLASLVTHYGRCYGDVYIAMNIDNNN